MCGCCTVLVNERRVSGLPVSRQPVRQRRRPHDRGRARRSTLC
jgi:hypothetical protein